MTPLKQRITLDLAFAVLMYTIQTYSHDLRTAHCISERTHLQEITKLVPNLYKCRTSGNAHVSAAAINDCCAQSDALLVQSCSA